MIHVLLNIHETSETARMLLEGYQVPEISEPGVVIQELELLLRQASDPVVELWLENACPRVMLDESGGILELTRRLLKRGLPNSEAELLPEAMACLAEQPLKHPLYPLLEAAYKLAWEREDAEMRELSAEEVLDRSSQKVNRRLAEWIRAHRPEREIVVRDERPPFAAFLLGLAATYTSTCAAVALQDGSAERALRFEGLSLVYRRLAIEMRDAATALEIVAAAEDRPTALRLVIRGTAHRRTLGIAFEALGLEARMVEILRASDLFVDWASTSTISSYPFAGADRAEALRHLLASDLLEAKVEPAVLNTIPSVPLNGLEDWFKQVCGVGPRRASLRQQASALWARTSVQ